MRLSKDELDAAVSIHRGEHYSVLGDVVCEGWFPVVNLSGTLTGEVVEFMAGGYEPTDDGLAVMPE